MVLRMSLFVTVTSLVTRGFSDGVRDLGNLANVTIWFLPLGACNGSIGLRNLHCNKSRFQVHVRYEGGSSTKLRSLCFKLAENPYSEKVSCIAKMTLVKFSSSLAERVNPAFNE